MTPRLHRKPDPEIYKHALRLLNVEAGEVVFLDDIGPNLKAARGLGIRTIREYHAVAPLSRRFSDLPADRTSKFSFSSVSERDSTSCLGLGVDSKDSTPALRELSKVTGIELLDGADRPAKL